MHRHIAFYRRDDSFRLVGSSNRTCLHNGTKVHIGLDHLFGVRVRPLVSLVACYDFLSLACAAPPVVKRGYFEEKGLTAKYACKRRHSMIGNSTILYNASSSTWASPATCLKTGTYCFEGFYLSATLSVLLGCPDLHHPLNGIVHYNKKLSQVHYTCNQGYLLFGSPYRSCNETTGKWSGSRLSCTTSDGTENSYLKPNCTSFYSQHNALRTLLCFGTSSSWASVIRQSQLY